MVARPVFGFFAFAGYLHAFAVPADGRWRLVGGRAATAVILAVATWAAVARHATPASVVVLGSRWS